MAKLKFKLFKKFIHIIPIEDTYFVKKDVPDVKLNKEIVQLNYGLISPFKNGDIIFYKDRKNLYIWFTKHKLKTKKLCIPEGFLAHKKYKEKKEAILIKDIKNGEYGIVIIKNGTIIAQFSKNGEPDNQFIEILNKEYSLQKPEIVSFGPNSTGIELNAKDISRFLNSFDINTKSVLMNLYEEIKIPVIVLLILLNTLDVFMYQYVSNTIKKKKTELNKLIKTNKTIKKQFTVLEKESNFVKHFINTELKYPNLLSVLSVITKSAAKSNAIIKTYRQSNNIINLWVISSSTSSFVNSLIATKYFYNVQVITISQYPKDTTKELGEISINIRAKRYVR